MPKVVLKDHYVVLGAERGTSTEEIKSLYIKRAREFHPDLLGPDASEEDKKLAEELFKEVALAYEQLSDPKLRKEVDLWLFGPSTGFSLPDEDFFRTDYFRRPRYDHYQKQEPIEVPTASQFVVGGIWCRVEFSASVWSSALRAKIVLHLNDLFKVEDFEDLPHDAWLDEVVVTDEFGEVVGRSYSVRSLQFDIRKLEAEKRRNEDRREWRAQLAELERQREELAAQHLPVGRLDDLLWKAKNLANAGKYDLRHAIERDTVVRAIREVEKEIDRVGSSNATELLLNDLLDGKIGHHDLDYNKALLEKLSMYELKSGGAYTAPTKEKMEAHYRQRLTGLTTHVQLHNTDLKLEDDEPIILELIQEGAIEMAPDMVQAPGNKGLSNYPVTYGRAKVNGEAVPVGIITVSQTVYERNVGYKKASSFPKLPFGITLLIRVKVKVQDQEMLSDPYPEDKSLQNEVSRCLARLRNPKEPVETYATTSYLMPVNFY